MNTQQHATNDRTPEQIAEARLEQLDDIDHEETRQEFAELIVSELRSQTALARARNEYISATEVEIDERGEAQLRTLAQKERFEIVLAKMRRARAERLVSSGMLPYSFVNAEQKINGEKVAVDPVAATAIVLETKDRVMPDASDLLFCQRVSVIGGRPSFDAQLILGILRSGNWIRNDEWESENEGTDAERCRFVAEVRNAHSGEWAECYGDWVEWSTVVAEGWNAPVAVYGWENGKRRKTGESPGKWDTMRSRMFRYRAASWFARDYLSHVTSGLTFKDEAEDIARQESRVIDSRPVETPTPQPAATNEAEAAMQTMRAKLNPGPDASRVDTMAKWSQVLQQCETVDEVGQALHDALHEIHDPAGIRKITELAGSIEAELHELDDSPQDEPTAADFTPRPAAKESAESAAAIEEWAKKIARVRKEDRAAAMLPKLAADKRLTATGRERLQTALSERIQQLQRKAAQASPEDEQPPQETPRVDEATQTTPEAEAQRDEASQDPEPVQDAGPPNDDCPADPMGAVEWSGGDADALLEAIRQWHPAQVRKVGDIVETCELFDDDGKTAILEHVKSVNVGDGGKLPF